MAYVGIDGHKKQSQMCLLTAAGEILPQRIPTPSTVRSGGLRQSHAI